MNLAAIGLDRTVLELKMYFREKEAVFFSFLFPILLLALFSVIFGDSSSRGGSRDAARPGSSCPAWSPAVSCSPASRRWRCPSPWSATTARSSGCAPPRCRRWPTSSARSGWSPSPRWRRWPCSCSSRGSSSASRCRRRGGRWAVFAWVFVLGVFGGTVLGIAYSSLAGSAHPSAPWSSGRLLVLQFISGVYIAFDDVPPWLQQVALVFPLKWIAQGMRSVFFPAGMADAGDGRLLGDRPWSRSFSRSGSSPAWSLCARTFTLVQARHRS